MKVIENASIVCHSIGDHDMYIVMDELTGKTVRLQNPKRFDLELGLQGIVSYKQEPVMHLVNFELVMEEELV
jgi:hypothetical protein